MSNPHRHFYEFDGFRVDVGERVLLRDGEMVSLTQKAFDVLLVLVERQGGIVGKDELMEKVWPDTYVEESNLSQNIYTLRKTLGETPEGDGYIATVPRRGYRFSAPVREVREEIPQRVEIRVAEAPPPVADTTKPSAPAVPALPEPKPVNRLRFAALGVGAVGDHWRIVVLGFVASPCGGTGCGANDDERVDFVRQRHRRRHLARRQIHCLCRDGQSRTAQPAA